MIWQFNPYALPLFLAASISAALAMIMWRRRRLSGATSFTALLLLVCEWSFTEGLGYLSADLPSMLLWDKVTYLGTVAVPVVFLIFVTQYVGRDKWLSSRNCSLLCVLPVVTLLLHWTDEIHHFFYSGWSLVVDEGLSLLQVTYGNWFYVSVVYSYVLVLFGLVLLWRQFLRSRGVLRRQSVILMIGAAIPLAASVPDVFFPTPLLDLTPLAFAFTGLGFFWAVYRFRLFELMPRAREVIIRDLNDGVIVLDHDDHIVDLNPTAERLLGCVAAEAVGKSATAFLKSNGLSEQFLANSSSELASLDKDGVQRYLHIHFSALRDQRGDYGYVGILHDVTERKRMEDDLLRSQRLAAIGETAAMIGHDLRNPLQGILVAAKVLEEHAGSEADETTRKMLVVIKDDVEYANTILEELLDYAREIKLNLSWNTVKSVLNASLTLVQKPDCVTVQDLADDISARMDPQKMTRVFVNIISNAFDAMPDGGLLTIAAKQSDGSLEVSFTDTGVGISTDAINKVSKPLYTTKARGVGLGLAISKRIVEAHGGTLSFDSAHGVGSEFKVTIPIENGSAK